MAGGWGSEVKDGKGMEKGRAPGVSDVGELEFSGVRKENVLSKAFQSTAITNPPERRPSRRGFPRTEPPPWPL